MRYRFLAAALCGLLTCPPVWAGHVAVSDAWVRASLPGQQTAVAYMVITAAQAARLIGVRSPVSARAEVHSMRIDGNVMRMRVAQPLRLPPHTAVKLQPGGDHVMLMNLKKPVVRGTRVPLVLIVETQGKRESVHVEALARGPLDAPDVNGVQGHHQIERPSGAASP